MAAYVEHGLETSGTTAQRPANAEVGFKFFDTTLGYMVVYMGSTLGWKPVAGIVAEERTFTEDGAGTYTGSVTVPAGATILDVIVHNTVLWAAATSATMKVGDATDDDGIFTGVNLKATDLLAAESINFDRTGGKEGAYLVGTATHWTTRYLATARVISGIITSVGAGTAGRTRMVVVYMLPMTSEATKV